MKRMMMMGWMFLASLGQVYGGESTSNRDAMWATLQSAPWDPQAMQQVQALMRNASEPAALRSRAMALCTLAILKQGNTNQFVRAVQMLETTYPEEKGLVTATAAEQFEACPECKGKGQREISCSACKGKSCPRCKGTQKIQTGCSSCMGAGQHFKAGPSIQANYDRIVAEIIAVGAESKRFEEQATQALAEKDTSKRIARLEAVLAAFPKRADLERLTKSLEASKKLHDAELAKKLEQEKRDKEDATVERLLALRQAPRDQQVAAIQEIDSFLIKHPNVYGRAELEEVKTELESKVKFRQRMIRSGYWLGGLCAMMVVVTFLKMLFFSGKPVSTRPLPGMDRIDKNKFTDPLAEERERTEEQRDNEEG